ncbi:calcium/calmodulin-regulated receptor-like kinase 2 [Magnolia sinica]|uniref:calcium/calmodulin-regulated receptor-like kinase 2 n=1 Tax=Magnolia sinica TaxID=86752 RepID=UPI0026586595|nr:calcium/calmodulin-regulated receptor-like kinase 2 [Magnolia sinica]XP_058115171.1 calcium/calmodulin-regulated receptor-like kinase 2 [Magnolia sinica]XP_058115172.1 calcium/calmodulin-regulated receptor-like kinase 2 [Magnolia sinica]XP_058115173.1 calcium/calmodulin-regulated receptor-like kinase 2 [Magnolia sinica]XP_058115174.1 calcium/calmodulin-regulated receptor-like kinase 2 [Magnolia sinica]XP_058115175.1 calcium/calmodulin-regulated receptor-like kinase 2 [Magnolia sinica]XP_05
MHQTELVIVCVTVGVAFGILAASGTFIAVRLYRKRSRLQNHSNENGVTTLPIRANGIGTSMESSVSLSHSDVFHGSPHLAKKSTQWSWWGSHDNKDMFSSVSGIPRYSYKDIQKATQNFTTILGQGSFGPVYKAMMPTGEVVAVKVLASNSRQGEREFQTEVLLLARLHHRNLVNLVGYCVDKSQHMLIYEFMSNGSLASLLYSEGPRVLTWEERLQIALDVSHGIEYLHEGAVPPVIHRDLKSANILLDRFMRAKVADFGLSKEESYDGRNSGLKGTYGYIDPEYMSTNKFTKKSDIYSFGIILFELITAINPQQGLLDYVNLAAMDGDSKGGWDEILDKQLVGNCDPKEVRLLASTAYKCVHKTPRKRPSILDISQAISRITQQRLTKVDTMSSGRGDISRAVSRIEHQQIELGYMTSINERSQEH